MVWRGAVATAAEEKKRHRKPSAGAAVSKNRTGRGGIRINPQGLLRAVLHPLFRGLQEGWAG